MNIIKGNDLMLFVKQGNTTRSLAFATSHTLTITADTSDISTKDHGFWGGKEVTRITWSIQTDNLYTVEEFNNLYDLMIARAPIPVYFCLKNDAELGGTPPTVNLPGDSANTWHPTQTKGKEGYYGQVYITSLTANAASGDNATFSATLDGVGAITKGLQGSVEQGNGGNIVITTTTGTVIKTEYVPESDTDTFSDQKTYYIVTGKDQMTEVEFADADEYNKAKANQNIYTEKVA